MILSEMVTQKQSLPSFASILSALSIVFYCAGFLKVELELHEQNEWINALENNGQTEQRPSFGGTQRICSSQYLFYRENFAGWELRFRLFSWEVKS